MKYKTVSKGYGLQGFMFALYAVEAGNFELSKYHPLPSVDDGWKVCSGPYKSFDYREFEHIGSCGNFSYTMTSDSWIDCPRCVHRIHTSPPKVKLSFFTYYPTPFDRKRGIARLEQTGLWAVEGQLAADYLTSGLSGLQIITPNENNEEDLQGLDVKVLLPTESIIDSSSYGDLVRCPLCSKWVLVSNDVDSPMPSWAKKFYSRQPKFEMSREVVASAVFGSSWSGHDFCMAVDCGRIGRDITYCTRRALDWLLSIHAGPFMYRDVDFLLNGTTQHHWNCIHQSKGQGELKLVEFMEDGSGTILSSTPLDENFPRFGGSDWGSR